MINRDVIFYFKDINVIGGVESFFYYMTKKYKNFTIIYKTSDPNQVKRLNERVETLKYNGEILVCDKFICNYGTDMFDKIKANEKILMIHTDYQEMNRFIPDLDKYDKFIGVSKAVCDGFKRFFNKDIELIYNPVEIDEPKKILKLISCTRLTNGKGKDRMKILSQRLDSEKIPYLWLVFTNDKKELESPNVFYMKPKLDIIGYIKDSDYLVQLSDDIEGFGYTVAESLSVGTPVITTKCKAFLELGIKDKVNGFLLDFDMKDIPIKEIYKGLPEFTYKAPKSNWNKYLNNKTNYDPNKIRRVRPIRTYYDLELLKNVHKGDEPFEVTQKRANFLVSDLKTVIYDD